MAAGIDPRAYYATRSAGLGEPAAAALPTPEPVTMRDARDLKSRLVDLYGDSGLVDQELAKAGIETPGVLGEIGRGMQRGGYSSAGSVGTALEALGAPGTGKQLQEWGEKGVQRPDLQPAVGSLDQVKNASDFGYWLAQATGASIPETAATVAAGVATGGAGAAFMQGVRAARIATVLGASSASALPHFGRNIQAQVEELKKTNPDASLDDVDYFKAGAATAAQVLADSALPSVLAKRLGIGVGEAKEAAKGMLAKAAKSSKAAATDFGIEGGTEIFQEAVQQVQAQTGIDGVVQLFQDPDTYKAWAEAGLAGGMVGAAIGAPSVVVENVRGTRAETAERAVEKRKQQQETFEKETSQIETDKQYLKDRGGYRPQDLDNLSDDTLRKLAAVERDNRGDKPERPLTETQKGLKVGYAYDLDTEDGPVRIRSTRRPGEYEMYDPESGSVESEGFELTPEEMSRATRVPVEREVSENLLIPETTIRELKGQRDAKKDLTDRLDLLIASPDRRTLTAQRRMKSIKDDIIDLDNQIAESTEAAKQAFGAEVINFALELTTPEPVSEFKPPPAELVGGAAAPQEATVAPQEATVAPQEATVAPQEEAVQPGSPDKIVPPDAPVPWKPAPRGPEAVMPPPPVAGTLGPRGPEAVMPPPVAGTLGPRGPEAVMPPPVAGTLGPRGPEAVMPPPVAGTPGPRGPEAVMPPPVAGTPGPRGPEAVMPPPPVAGTLGPRGPEAVMPPPPVAGTLGPRGPEAVMPPPVAGESALGVARAKEWVLSKGRETGNEYLVALDSDGNPVGTTTGHQTDGVVLSDELMTLARDGKNDLSLHHNHPRGSLLSATDVLLGWLPGVGKIVAYGQGTGAESSVELTPEQRRGMTRDEFQDVYEKLGNELIKPTMWELMDAKAINIGEANLLHPDILFRAFTEAGLANFDTKFPPMDISKGVRERLDEVYGKVVAALQGADRPSGPIRPGRRARKVPAKDGKLGAERSKSESRDKGKQERSKAVDFENIATENQTYFLEERATYPPFISRGADGNSVKDWVKQNYQVINSPNKADRIKDARVEIEQAISNQFAPFRELEIRKEGALLPGMDSAFKAAEMATNDTGRTEMLMHYGAPKMGSYGEVTVAPDTMGLLDIFKIAGGTGEDRGQRLADWQHYMVARRAKQLSAQGKATPLSKADIDKGLSFETSEFKNAANEWKKFNDASVKFAKDSGLLTKEAAKALMDDAVYVPFYRAASKSDMESGNFDLASSRDIAGHKLTGAKSGIRGMKGSEHGTIDNVLLNMLRNSQAMIQGSMRNQAAQKVYSLLGGVEPGKKPSPEAELTLLRPSDDKKGSVSLRVGGNDVYFRPDDPMITLALAGLSPVQRDGLWRLMRNMASFFRTGVTLAPAFMIRNLIRGMVATGILTGGKNIRKFHTGHGFMEAWNYDKKGIRGAFTRMSGMGDYKFGGSKATHDNDLLIDLGLEPKTFLSRARKAIDAMEKVGTATELADRLALYHNLIKDKVRPDEAAYQALNVLNYGRRGSNMTLQNLVPLVPFLNARIQGLYRLTEDLRTRPGTVSRRKVLRQIALRGAPLMAVSLGLWLLNNADEEDRERYEAEPLYRRLNYHIIYAGDKKILIPKAFEIGALFGTVPEMLAEVAQGDTDEIAPALVQTVLNTFAFNPLPQAILPALEVYANLDMFRQRPIEGIGMGRVRNVDRVNPDTSGTARSLSKVFSNVPGLDRLSPVEIEHLLTGYTGAFGNAFLASTDLIAGELGFIPQRPEGAFGDISVLSEIGESVIGSMVKNVDADAANRYVGDFYQLKQAITEIHTSARDAARQGDMDYAKELLQKAPQIRTAYALVNRASALLGKLNTRIKSLRLSTISSSEKRRLMIPLIDKRNKLARQVRDTIKRMEDSMGTTFQAVSR